MLGLCCGKKPAGLNPGKRLERLIGRDIEERTGDPDTTFKQLYDATGVELCTVVCNLTCMVTEEWHVKTTPNKKLREAVRISMGIPGFFAPLTELGVRGEELSYGDGGTLCNFPLHVFDGWCDLIRFFIGVSLEFGGLCGTLELFSCVCSLCVSERIRPRRAWY
jgi:predicted acylesterase/phospholipase RssA